MRRHGRLMFARMIVILIAVMAGPASLAQDAEPPVVERFGAALAAAAVERTHHEVRFEPAYRVIDYPGGDVPADEGVCSDVVIRALRALGVDLQQEIHEDMQRAFVAYPDHWGLSRPDRNIDHRRVPNIEKYLARKGAAIPISDRAADYQPGDIVAWNLRGESGGWLPHIGIVTDRNTPSGRLLIAHNIGAGPKLEDVLFDWPITGQYRFRP